MCFFLFISGEFQINWFSDNIISKTATSYFTINIAASDLVIWNTPLIVSTDSKNFFFVTVMLTKLSLLFAVVAITMAAPSERKDPKLLLEPVDAVSEWSDWKVSLLFVFSVFKFVNNLQEFKRLVFFLFLKRQIWRF